MPLLTHRRPPWTPRGKHEDFPRDPISMIVMVRADWPIFRRTLLVSSSIPPPAGRVPPVLLNSPPPDATSRRGVPGTSHASFLRAPGPWVRDWLGGEKLGNSGQALTTADHFRLGFGCPLISRVLSSMWQNPASMNSNRRSLAFSPPCPVSEGGPRVSRLCRTWLTWSGGIVRKRGRKRAKS